MRQNASVKGLGIKQPHVGILLPTLPAVLKKSLARLLGNFFTCQNVDNSTFCLKVQMWRVTKDYQIIFKDQVNW